MNVILQRTDYGPDGVFGMLTNEAAQQEIIAVTLEHAFPQIDGNLTEYLPKIPAGIYTCKKYQSPHFNKEVWMLQDVPGHTHVEIHCGNYNSDSDGCILLGRRVIPDPDNTENRMITSSINTFNKFMDLQRDVDSFQLTIQDAE